MVGGTVLVVGQHGVTGGAIARRLETDPRWTVLTTSRRSDPSANHFSADLLQSGSLVTHRELSAVTHVVYAAYVERPTMSEAVGPNVTMLRTLFDDLFSLGAPLQQVVLIGGGKSYGEHLGHYRTPAKESDPRVLGPIFYNDQEDLLRAESDSKGFSFTVLRPDIAIGFALGSPMNLLGSIGTYAALCLEEGIPLRFPGSGTAWRALQQFTDTDILASAVNWSLTSQSARNEVFNVTNGDNFRWEHLWPDIAAVFDLDTATPQPLSLQEHLGGRKGQWASMVERHGLRPSELSQISSWPFADAIFSSGFDMVQSTIKIRQAGFADCVDSHSSVISQLQSLRDKKYLP